MCGAVGALTNGSYCLEVLSHLHTALVQYGTTKYRPTALPYGNFTLDG